MRVSLAKPDPTYYEGRVWLTDCIVFVLKTTGSRVGDKGLEAVQVGVIKTKPRGTTGFS